MGRWLTVLAVLAWVGPGWAQTVQVPAAEASDAAGTALVEAFQAFCLGPFPGGVMESGAPGKLVPLPPAQVRQYLHEDPGRAWTYHGPDGDYVLTVEEPPYHTCAVRREYASAPKLAMAWALSTGLWGAAQRRPGFEAARTDTFRQNGLVIRTEARVLPGTQPDMFMRLETLYPDGHVEERLARRAVGR